MPDSEGLKRKIYTLLAGRGTVCYSSALCEECFRSKENRTHAQGLELAMRRKYPDIPPGDLDHWEDSGDPCGHLPITCCICDYPYYGDLKKWIHT